MATSVIFFFSSPSPLSFAVSGFCFGLFCIFIPALYRQERSGAWPPGRRLLDTSSNFTCFSPCKLQLEFTGRKKQVRLVGGSRRCRPVARPQVFGDGRGLELSEEGSLNKVCARVDSVRGTTQIIDLLVINLIDLIHNRFDIVNYFHKFNKLNKLIKSDH